MQLEIITKNPSETKKIGKILAYQLKTPALITLEGDLGGGKTTFIKGLARGLGIKKRITSPTFLMIKKYKIPTVGYLKAKNYFYHIDCYRIKSPRHLLNFGLEEILKAKNAIVTIEWANKIKNFLPKKRIDIKFGWVDKTKRRLIIKR